MRVGFEFLALLRVKAGVQHLELEVGGGAPSATAARSNDEPLTVLEALRVLQRALSERGVRLLAEKGLAEGILVFLRNSGGGLTRVLDPAKTPVGEGERVVLSTAMGGG